MKKKTKSKRTLILSLLLVSLLLSACNLSKKETQKDNNKKQVESTITNYDDGTVLCKYDSSLLQRTKVGFDDNDDCKYGVIFTKQGDTEASAISDGSCTYVNKSANSVGGISDFDVSERKMLYKTFLTALFDIKESDPGIVEETSTPENGIFEYKATDAEGNKYYSTIFNMTDTEIFFSVCRIMHTEDAKHRDALLNCYKSFKVG